MWIFIDETTFSDGGPQSLHHPPRGRIEIWSHRIRCERINGCLDLGNYVDRYFSQPGMFANHLFTLCNMDAINFVLGYKGCYPMIRFAHPLDNFAGGLCYSL